MRKITPVHVFTILTRIQTNTYIFSAKYKITQLWQLKQPSYWSAARVSYNQSRKSPVKKKTHEEIVTYASSFPFSSVVTFSFWLLSFDWHPMARYWATSGWTKLSICVLLDGSISSFCFARCASAVSLALCWLVNEHYTIKIHTVLAVSGRPRCRALSLRMGYVLHQ